MTSTNRNNQPATSAVELAKDYKIAAWDRATEDATSPTTDPRLVGSRTDQPTSRSSAESTRGGLAMGDDRTEPLAAPSPEAESNHTAATTNGHEQPPQAAPDEATLTRRRLIMIAVSAFVVLGVGLLVSVTRSPEREPNWVELGRPVTMPDITLTGTDGEPYNLRAESAGRLTLLYFGYLNCPDACPIHMSVLGMTFEQLPTNISEQIDVVFITTDPERDSPAELEAFLDRFNSTFIGLTGSTQQLQDAQIAAGVPVAVTEPADEHGEYLVGHATQVLVFEPDGVARRVYPFGVRQSDWVEDLPKLVPS